MLEDFCEVEELYQMRLDVLIKVVFLAAFNYKVCPPRASFLTASAKQCKHLFSLHTYKHCSDRSYSRFLLYHHQL